MSQKRDMGHPGLGLLGCELEDGGGFVGLAGAESGGGEAGVVGRVGEVLGFEAEAAVLFVLATGASGEGSVEEVAGVELDAGLGGVEGEGAAGGGVGGAGGGMGEVGGGLQDEVV